MWMKQDEHGNQGDKTKGFRRLCTVRKQAAADMETALNGLRKRAVSLFDIPSSYRLLIEDGGRHQEGKATFLWVKPDSEEGIAVTFSSEGKLVEFTQDVPDEWNRRPVLPVDALRRRAEQFVSSNEPKALEAFSHVTVTTEKNGVWVHFRQEALGLPLPLSGCRVKVHQSGAVTDFTYFGVQPLPETPAPLVEEAVCERFLENDVTLTLVLKQLPESVFAGGGGTWRLVYEPEPVYLTFSAETGPQAKAAADEEDVNWLPLSAEAVSACEQGVESLEELIGIDPVHYERIQQTALFAAENQTAVVWGRRDRVSQEPDRPYRSIREFFLRRQEERAAMAQLDANTGRLLSFWRWEEEAGTLRLSREECLERAVSFLRRAVPELLPLLELASDVRDEGGDERREREHFRFRVRRGGIPCEPGFLFVTVHSSTGRIERFSGLDAPPNGLIQAPIIPALPPREALRRLREETVFRLQWERCRDGGQSLYRLQYAAVHKESGLPVRLVDACSGEVICERRHG
jgi:hypothetical protein